MFSKKFISKNLIALLAIIFVVALFIAPRFLTENKTNNNSHTQKTQEENKSSQTSDQNDSLTTKPETKEGSQPSSATNVQGATTQKTPAKTNQPKPTTSVPTNGSTSEAGEPVVREVTLQIKAGSSNYSYQVTWTSGMTVYEVLNKAHTENNFSLKSRWYGGSLNSEYVTEIHGYNCECWEYQLNNSGKDHNGNPLKGASLVTVEPNDIITWKTT